MPDELIKNFQLVRNDRRYGRGGGTCIYIRNKLKFDNDLGVISDCDVEIQGLLINGEGTRPQKQIALVMVYRPPRGSSMLACTKIKDYIQSITNIQRKEIVLVGDFNWNVRVDHSSCLGHVEEIATEFGLKQLINCATRVGTNSASTIDLMFSNITNIYRVGCLTGTCSDHYPTFLIKKRIKPVIDTVEIRRRKMSRCNIT